MLHTMTSKNGQMPGISFISVLAVQGLKAREIQKI
jgi:hypothetical protein